MFIDNVNIPKIEEEDHCMTLGANLTIEEVSKAIRYMKSRKRTELDDFPMDISKMF